MSIVFGLTASCVARRIIIASLAVMLVPARLHGQTAEKGADAAPRWELGAYLGISRHSPAGWYFGLVPDRSHLFVGLQLTANLYRTRRWALAYAPEVVPLLVVSNNPMTRSVPTRRGGRLRVESGRAPVAGFAISPIGLQAQLRIASRWRTYAGGAAGVVWFTREVPVVNSRAFNYTFEFGAGVRWSYRPSESLRFGFKLHHLSNANTAERNPGLDAAALVIGYERAFGSRR